MQFVKFFKLILATIAIALVAGCAATGPLHSEVAATIPPVPSDKGRIIFFRPNTVVGAAITSDIQLNSRIVGTSERGSFFFVDEVPGNYIVATSTEVEKQLTFTLAAGETKYVKTSVSLGLLVGRINPELASTDEWKAEVPELHYTGSQLKR